MIKNIILRGVSSYSPDANSNIGPLTKVNVFYGHNGTGKTTIGNYLQNPAETAYRQCSVQPMDVERELLVYNHTFMESNFYASSQPGVFTLNEGNIEAEKALQAAEAELKSLSQEQQTELNAGLSLVDAQKANEEKLRESLWALKKPYDTSALKYCFASLNTKERLAEKVIPLKLVPVSDSFESLAAEAQQLQSASDDELAGISSFRFPEGDIEQNPFLQEVVTGSGNSYLSAIFILKGPILWGLLHSVVSVPPFVPPLCFCVILLCCHLKVLDVAA